MIIRTVEYGYEIEVTHINGNRWVPCIIWFDDNDIRYNLTLGGVAGHEARDYVTFEQKADALEFKMKFG